MPSGPLNAAHLIVGTVLTLEPRRILDLGVGTGKYGFLLREQSDLAASRTARDSWQLTIEGVEAYAPYVGDHQRAVYDRIWIADVRDFVRDYDGERYDVGLAFDIIEHLEPDEGVDFADAALRSCDFLFLSTPKGYFAQNGHENAFERHRSWWPVKALKHLARRCGAEVSVAQILMCNVAVLSRAAPPPRLRTYRLFDALAFAKDVALPELAYYRAIGKTGPTILG